ncbi:MAG: protein kinase [Anaerolineae bacterium]|nr:protein kinase [Anaerolineae bacterium]
MTSTTSTTSTTLRGPWLLVIRLAWLAIALYVIVMLIIGLPGAYRSYIDDYPALRQTVLSQSLPADWPAFYILGWRFVAALSFCAMALLLVWRKSRDWMGLFSSATCIAFGVAFSSYIYEAYIYQDILPSILVPVATEFSRALGFIFSVIFLFLFPNGKFVPRWSRWLALLWSLWMIGGVFVPVLRISDYPFHLFIGIQVVVYGVGLAMQIYRYRYVSTSSQRQQTKWVIWGIAATLAGFVISMYVHFFAPTLSNPLQVDLIGLLINEPFYYAPRTILAITIGLAILRYRLWDIDFILNRSMVYGTITVLLAAVFGISLFAISHLFRHFAQGPLVAVAISAAFLGATFQPARRRIKRFVDRRFYNIQIDYQEHARARDVSLPSEGATQIIRQTRFREYSNLELIGRGGMAEVYKADHPTLKKRPVAIKLLPAALSLEPEFRQRFLREAEVVSRLEHSNIVRVFDYGEEGGTCYIVMEYLAGQDLDSYLREIKNLSLGQALPILGGVAAALDYAHEAGLVHRDIKPSNVMLDKNGKGTGSLRAVLMDFGIARIIGGQTVLTTAGGIIGTLDYIAPEQIQAATDVDGRADIYSLGVMTYRMLTGGLPFKQKNPGSLLLAHLFQPPPDAHELIPDLPNVVSMALEQAMAKKPEERFAKAGEFVAQLSKYQSR